MMETRLLLGGGGSEIDEYPIHELFASWIRPGPILYLPIAMEFIGLAQERWIKTALHPHGINQIEIWKSLKGHTPTELNRFRGVFIGGGNTYHLLQQLRISGFDKAISDFISLGGTVYGGSAGAIIMGKDISPCAYIDPNNVGLTDLRGLDLMGGDSVWCHYQDVDEKLVQEYVDRSLSTTFALPETGGLWVCGQNDYHRLGSGNIICFGLKEHHIL
jgi:dipeptidase E